MKILKALKIGSIIIILMTCLVIGINYGFRLSEDNFVSLIYAGIISSAAIFTAVATSKTNSQITDIKTDTKNQLIEFRSNINGLKTKVSYFDESLKVFDYTVKNMNEKQVALEIGFIDIKTSIKNKEKINHLCQRMESLTFEIFENHFDINSDFRDYIIQVIDGIGVVIKNQYEYGFDEFNPAYFKRKIIKRLDLVSKNSNVNKELLPKLTSSINKNICNYITDIDDIKYLVNGERRELFEKKTIAMTNKLSYHSIEIFKEEKK